LRSGANSKQIHNVTCYEGTEGEQWCRYTLSLTLTLDGAGCLMPRPGHFSPGNDPVPRAQEAELVPGVVCLGAENTFLFVYSVMGIMGL